ncbi:hypothetical protein GCM10023184_47230 [Flaviaesturariibacter amylovorans]|uniref:Exo-alpha-sialidase n=2 Tax=Flaviaesturariibacter amylovorans TaxID=1084520 RepID=A0ABP8HVE5_9BACT
MGKNVSFADADGLYLTDGQRLYHSNPAAANPLWTEAPLPSREASISAGRTGVLAYTFGGSLFRKAGGSEKWLPVYTNFGQKTVRTVFESAAGPVFIGTDSGLFKSGDAGKTWKQVHPAGLVWKIAESNGVLLALNNQGIIRSTDGGEHWAFAVYEHRRGFVIAGIDGGFAVGLDRTAKERRSLRTSFDGGATWEHIDAGLPADASTASVVQVGVRFFCSQAAGVFGSADKGKTWQLLLPSINDKIFQLHVSGKVLYAVPRTRGC